MNNRLRLLIERFHKYHGTLLEENERLLESGRRHADKGKFNEAIVFFNQALELSEQIHNRDGVLGALANKADTLLNKGSLEEALITYKKVVEFDPTNQALFDIGYLYGEMGKYNDSVKSYELYLKFYPDDYAAIGNIAWAYEQLNELEKAEKYYKIAKELEPENLSVINRLVILLDRLGKKDQAKEQEAQAFAEDALKIYNKKIEEQPKNADILVNKAIALDVIGKKGIALDFYNAALKIDKDNAFALYNLSCTQALLKKTQESLIHLDKAIRLDPTYRDLAKSDPDFDHLQQNSNFRSLVD